MFYEISFYFLGSSNEYVPRKFIVRGHRKMKTFLSLSPNPIFGVYSVRRLTRREVSEYAEKSVESP